MRRAVTLLETLVAIGIVGAATSLILPAVQNARTAAARVKCANNLKQLAMACHGYNDQYRRLPSGGYSSQSVADPQGWAWQIKEYHERNMAAHYCPSKPDRSFPQWGTDAPTRMNDYAGADLDGQGVFPNAVRGVRLSDLANGASGTLMLSEKRINLAQAAYGRTYNDDFGPFAGFDHDAMCTASRPPLPDFHGGVADAQYPVGYSVQYGDDVFGSSHIGGLNAAYADGHVVLVMYSVDTAVWRRSGRR